MYATLVLYVAPKSFALLLASLTSSMVRISDEGIHSTAVNWYRVVQEFLKALLARQFCFPNAPFRKHIMKHCIQLEFHLSLKRVSEQKDDLAKSWEVFPEILG